MTIFEGRDGVALYQLITLKHAMKLSMNGVQPGRGWTKKAMLALASKFTGKNYKRGIKGFSEAFDDVCSRVDQIRNGRTEFT